MRRELQASGPQVPRATTQIPVAPEVARRLADELEAAAIPYAIGGAIAYGLHAPPRATNDVDLNVFLEPAALRPAFAAIERAGGVLDHQTASQQATAQGSFTADVEGMRVDVFVPSIPLYAAAAKRLRRGVLLGRPVTVLSAEDLTLFKLLFFRGKDRTDIERLVAFRGGALDREYVRGWLLDLVGAADERVVFWDGLPPP